MGDMPEIEDNVADVMQEGAVIDVRNSVTSILHDRAIRRNSIVIKGHTNKDKIDEKAPTQVRTHSQMARFEDQLSLDDMKELKDTWDYYDGELNSDAFRATFSKQLGDKLGPDFAERITYLFKKMDTNHDAVVDWHEFCTYVLIGLQEKDALDHERETPLQVCYDTMLTGCPDNIVRIQSLSAPTRFVTVSESGQTTFYDSKMRVSNVLYLSARGAAGKGAGGGPKTIKTTIKVTDAYFMVNAWRICLATSARELQFYHASAGRLMNTVLLPHVASCIDYHFNVDNTNEAVLVFGDLKGNVGAIQFRKACQTMFDSMVSWRADRAVSLTDLPTTDVEHTGEPPITTCDMRQAHIAKASDDVLTEAVKMVKYSPAMQAVISCAGTTDTALAITDLSLGTTRGRVRHCFMPKACSHFDCSDELNMVCTGGVDATVRLWNPYITSRPLAVFRGHRDPIVRVALNPTFKQAISLASSEVIKIWDVVERVCLNTLVDIFPHPEFWVKVPISTFHWHDQSQSIIVACSKELTILQLHRDTDAMASHTSHEAAVTCATYLHDIDLVCTGDTAGTIITWNMSTGEKSHEFKHAHFQGAITCLTPGFHGRRLVSGSSNGEIFVWNVQAGVVLQHLVKTNPQEVDGVVSLDSKVYAIGDDGALIRFLDHEEVDIAKAPMVVKQDTTYIANKAHTADVNCSASCGDSLMASGGEDGQILVWNVKVGLAVKSFSAVHFRMQWKSVSVKAKRHYPDGTFFPDVGPTAAKQVDALVWLKERVKAASSGNRECATLIATCDGGAVAFWNALKGDMLGGFYVVPSNRGQEAVHGLTVSSDNALLFTGDSMGNIRVFDIRTYCLHGFDDKPPKALHGWQGHTKTITNLEYVEQRGVLLTCSYDCSVRVWNIKGPGDVGEYVGSFGAGVGWNLTTRFSLHKTQTLRRTDSLSPERASPSPTGKVGSKLTRRDTFKASAAMSAELHAQKKRMDEEERHAQAAGKVPAAEVAVDAGEHSSPAQPPSLDSASEDTPDTSGNVSQSPVRVSIEETIEEGDEAEAGPAEDDGTDDSDDADDEFAEMMRQSTMKEEAEEDEQMKRASRVTFSAKLRRANDWDRRGPLGGMYTAAMVERHHNRMAMQKEAGRQPTAQDAAVPRLPNICAPFSALSLRHATLEPVTSVRVPSAVVRSRRATALDALDSANDEQRAARTSWGGAKAKGGRKQRGSDKPALGRLSPQKAPLPPISGSTT
mmetsp:Transcript_24890/g.64815  ORF Transcript_24890/g.64815 Transcript_24890/m.64815 type:complete len:1231 (+) Transcript_24890:364-4056(+)|eukprot:CAMPEP_0182942586 /NCGR_PEP_ID=MMETSP0105_2-20130417/50952_1 /TAXON_ID=81532 ORGANISM="Acanthoeca-like sp., Strain 10tr" /NCGR_SAMPLE_ID=MMETSP0105_2 /ASSEMBLY_ACC=CAM_ASM_000205 /LENGTH=1230 /DNA_ID=CAMNT_0025082335 /DNA_START=247 /DNA_END=3939 /DNA_ORIENTATION=-